MTSRFSWSPVLAVSLVALALGSPATAQVRLGLAGGFTPDPMEIALTASGDLAADTAVRGCRGFVAEDPTLVIDLSTPQLPFALGASADDGLAGVLVVAPDGIAHCALVDADGRALVRLDPAQPGEHAIWPALAEPGTPVAVSIFATELGATLAPRPRQLMVDATPAAGVHQVPAEGAGELDLYLSPTAAAAYLSLDCAGRINPARPDAVIALDAGEERLEIRAMSDEDTTLVVVGPDGEIACNDDTHGLNPAVVFAPAAGGNYAVWVGTYDDRGDASARLLFAAASDAFGLRATAEPAAGRHVLTAGDSVELDLALVGMAAAWELNANCAGQIDPSRPDAVIGLEADQGQLQLRATSQTDTTLVVVGPDGRYHCNDDADGLDPAVTVHAAPAGDYAVWVGSYHGGTAQARFTATAGEGPTPAAPGETHVYTGARIEALLNLTPTAPASDFGPDCSGQIHGAGPDAVIRLEAERDRVVFGANSDADTTLVVLAPGTGAYCNDDTHGLDPEVVLSPAPAGDYAVWIGTYGGDEATAVLKVHSEADGASFAEGFSPIDASPLLGRPLSSAAEALAILLDEGLSDVLTYESIEEQGAEGFTLTGVVATDPTGETPPMRMESLRVADLDLEGLTETGAPGRFRMEMEGIDYGTLIGALSEQGVIPSLPALDESSSLNVRASLLPIDGDTARREFTSEINLAGAFALAMDARMQWHDGVGVPDDIADLPTESMAIELRNYGYLGDLLRLQATEVGMDPAALSGLMLDSLGSIFGSVEPGSPEEQVVTALRGALADPDRSGVLRLAVSTEDPQGLDALMENFDGMALLDNPALDIEVTFTPLD